MSQKARNIKKIYKCKTAPNEKSKDQLEFLTAAQKDVNSIIKTVTVTDNAYIAFVYTEKQLNDVGKFCCKATNSSIVRQHLTYVMCG